MREFDSLTAHKNKKLYILAIVYKHNKMKLIIRILLTIIEIGLYALAFSLMNESFFKELFIVMLIIIGSKVGTLWGE